jgi:outer membrane protein assembly factor BamB
MKNCMLVATLAVSLVACAGDGWPNYRGPKNDGTSAEKLPSPLAVKELFKANVGEGYSGITESGGNIFAMGNAGGKDTVFCLDGTSGKEVWKYSYDCRTDKDYPGPRAAPVIDGGKVYTISRKGHIFCFDAAKGSVAWQKDAVQLGSAKPPNWDLAGSAVVVGNALIFGLNESGIALDKTSGNVLWKSPAGKIGYATPVPFDAGGAKGVAIMSGTKLTAVDPANGNAFWSVPWDTKYDVNSIDPVFQGDKFFITSGYGRGCAGFDLKGGKPNKLWENKEIASHFSNCVGLNGFVFGFDGQTGGNHLKCVDIASGTSKWAQPMGGTLILASDKLLILTTGGKLVEAEAAPAAYKELGSAAILSGKTCWTAPTLAGGKVYARCKEGDLVGVELSGK